MDPSPRKRLFFPVDMSQFTASEKLQKFEEDKSSATETHVQKVERVMGGDTYDPIDYAKLLFFDETTNKSFPPEVIEENVRKYDRGPKPLSIGSVLKQAENATDSASKELALTTAVMITQLNMHLENEQKNIDGLVFMKSSVTDNQLITMPSGVQVKINDLISNVTEVAAVGHSIEQVTQVIVRGIINQLNSVDPMIVLYSTRASSFHDFSSVYQKIPEVFFESLANVITEGLGLYHHYCDRQLALKRVQIIRQCRATIQANINNTRAKIKRENPETLKAMIEKLNKVPSICIDITESVKVAVPDIKEEIQILDD